MKAYFEILPELRNKITELCGSNFGISFPFVDLIGGVKVEKVFIYPVSPKEMRTRPFGVVTFSMEDGLILKYENAYVFDFVDREKYPFDKKISYEIPDGGKKTVKEHKLEMDIIFKLYEAIRNFAFEEELTKEQVEILTKYYVIFEKSVPSSNIPFYKALSEKYMEWVIKHV
jgi:hypothetical protein